MSKKSKDEGINIFDLLSEEVIDDRKNIPKSRREALLSSFGVKDFFEKGNISIDMRTCRGIECNLCVKTCPTNALYWKAGEIGIIDDLCLHCGACVLNCIVDNCIRITRERPDGTI